MRGLMKSRSSLRWMLVLPLVVFGMGGVAAAQTDSGSVRKTPKQPESGANDRSGSWSDDSGADGGGSVGTRLAPPGERPGGSTWKLGVTAENLDTGVRVTTVVANSAAQRAGLERGDVIVNVNGTQVGRVDGRVVELSDELQRRSDRNGRVRLLVHNTRNGRLENVDVTMQRGPGGNPGTPGGNPGTPGGNPGGPGRPGGNPGTPGDRPNRPGSPAELALVTGTATYRERIALPPGAMLTVKVSQVGRDGRGALLAERTVSNLRGVPIPFELRYDTRRVDANLRYELTAEITVDGRVIFATDRGEPVITGGSATNVNVTMVKSR